MFHRQPKYTGPERRRKPRWRPRPLRVLLLLLWLSAAGYAAAVLWLMTQETRIVVQSIQTLGDGRPPSPYEHVELPRRDGARQFAWVMPAGPAANATWVLYLHGNPSTVASPVNLAHYALLRNMGFSVLAPEYRGFAGLEGDPTERSLLADARAAFEYLQHARGVPPSRIVFYGWSLGGAIAVDLAAGARPAALILEGTPASVVDITARKYPLFPVHLLMRSRFEAVRKIDRVSCPVLVLHSPQDEVVPIAEGKRLYRAADSARFVEIRGGHTAAAEADAPHLADAIGRFLSDYRVLQAWGEGRDMTDS